MRRHNQGPTKVVRNAEWWSSQVEYAGILETLYSLLANSIIIGKLMNMVAKGLDHIGVAVRDLNGAISFYRDVLGLKLEGTHTLSERGVRVAFLSLGGEAHIELLEPLNSESTIAKFLSSHGEGMHHLALKVNDIEASLLSLKQEGLTLIDETPKEGAEGKKIAFVHPKSTRGVLLELCQQP